MKNTVFAIKEVIKVSKSIFFILAFLGILSSFITVIDLMLLKFIIDYALSSEFSFSTLLCYLLGYFFIVTAAKIFITILSKIWIQKNEIKLTSYAKSKLYQKVSELDLIQYDNVEFYNKLNRAFRENESQYYTVIMQLYVFLESIITFFSVFVLYHDFIILLGALISVLNYIIYYFFTNKKNYDFGKKEEIFSRQQDYFDRVFYLKEYAGELRMFPEIKEKLISNCCNETKNYIGRFNQYLRTYTCRSVLMITLGHFIFWVIGVYASIKLLNASVSIGNFLVMLNIVSSMAAQITNVLRILPDLYQSSLYINDIREIIEYPSCFNHNTGIIAKDFQSIEFKDVFFQYNGQSSFAIHDMNFYIKKGEVVAIVGLNGSGKSTLIDLLTGLTAPKEGAVKWNGISYQEYDIQSIRNLFSIAFQDFQIYEISVAENILMRKVVSDEDIATVNKALKYVKLYTKINALKDGIHTIISSENNSSNFSRGEKQKIAIARAYARQSPILIFDEPTSTLDIYAAKSFYHDIFQMNYIQGRTVIFITHKLYYTIYANKILYIENGTISEVGNHKELMELGKGYASLYKLQANELFN